MARFALIALLITLSIVAGDEPDPVRRGEVLFEPAEIGGQQVLRGTYEVFEDRAAGKGRRIPLEIVVAPALGENPAPDPIFTFSGGPGVAAVTWTYGLEDIAYLREKREIVMVSQRGTGQSNGLFCKQVGDPDKLQTYLAEMYTEPYVRVCREALAKRADLALYHTALAMDDINEVRAAMGYEKINLIGGSYGGRDVLAYVRRHGETVRSAVAEWPSPPWHTIPAEFAIDAQHALELLFRDCAADATCAERFPELEETAARAFARFDDGPVSVTLENPVTGAPETVSLARGVFATGVRALLYSPERAASLPLLLEAAAAGDFEIMVLFLAVYTKSLDEGLADGMYLSVTCAEDVPFIDVEKWTRASKHTFLGDYRIRVQKRGCDLWPRGEIPDTFREPLVSDVPILIVSGALDPVTPPRWAEQIAEGLKNGRHIRFAYAAHGGDAIFPCYDEMLDAFFERGSAESLDDACVAEVKRPPFATDLAEVRKQHEERARRSFPRKA